MAKRSSLSIRIVEGKNLPAKDITGSSDPYCIVKVDNEPIIRYPHPRAEGGEVGSLSEQTTRPLQPVPVRAPQRGVQCVWRWASNPWPQHALHICWGVRKTDL